jgi:hypothetical protein
MENGLIPAIHELVTELNRRKARQASVPLELTFLACGLLSRLTFDAQPLNTVRRVTELAKLAFSGPEAVAATANFATKFAAAIADYRTHGNDYAELACTLFKLQPLAAPDAFLSKPNTKRNLGFRPRIFGYHGPIVECAPEDVILKWVSLAPETRASLVAREISILANKSVGEAASELSSLAIRLLELSPDKMAVLDGFRERFNPSGWSDNIAQTCAPYLALLEGLTAHTDSVVASWAQSALQAMQTRFEHHGTLDVLREQAFE